MRGRTRRSAVSGAPRDSNQEVPVKDSTSAVPSSAVSRRRRGTRVSLTLAVGVVAALVTVFTVGSPIAGAAAKSSFLACMVTDTGGINDHSFNASAWQGMQAAKKADPSITIKYLQSTSSADYVPNINAFLGQKCGIIFTVGFLMVQATQNAAKAHPTDHFAIVDNAYDPPIKNVDSFFYDTDQDAFLGGYLAAGMSKTGSVGTFGGEDFSTVTIYMDGFWAGVQYYNQVNHTSVKVLGWNPNTNKGTFVGNFTNQQQGSSITSALMDQGADVIFPVAGGVGIGAAAAVKAKGAGYEMEWVDTDGCVAEPTYCGLFISSVTKGISESVQTAVLQTAHGKFQGGNSIGTLKNGQVVLSPYHDWASKIPSTLKAAITKIKAEIISGKIKININATNNKTSYTVS
jgi:basic membrane protein A and related proteins